MTASARASSAHLPSAPLPATSLTQLLRNPRVHAAWAARLPGTDELLEFVNRGTRHLEIPPSEWTHAQGDHATIGTAFDYAVGALCAGESLSPVFRRVALATRSDATLAGLIGALTELLLLVLPGWVPEELTPVQRDAFRGLGLLAELDAVYRSGAEPPLWTRDFDRETVSQATLLDALRTHYPDDFTDELLSLVRAALTDLPRGTETLYDPSFGSPPGLEHIRADGDLIVDDTLIELKVTLQPFRREHVWQLLGYVALDRLHGRARTQRVALYNPRFRSFWSDRGDHLAERLGQTSLADFCAWFRDTRQAHAG